MQFFTTFWAGARGQPQRPSPCPAGLSADDPCLSLAAAAAGNRCATVAGDPGKPPGKRRGKKASASRQPSGQPLPSPHRTLALALRDADGPLTVTGLAHAMGCCVGEASKRVAAARAAGLVRTRRAGRCKLVSLKPMTWPQWHATFSDHPYSPIGAAP